MATRRCTVLEGNWAELEAKPLTRDAIAVTNDHSELLHLAFLDEWLEWLKNLSNVLVEVRVPRLHHGDAVQDAPLEEVSRVNASNE
jgi:hypothetical protein